MAMNTPYLTADTSSQSNINTPYLLTGATAVNSDFSSTGTDFVGGNLIVRGTQTSTGTVTGGKAVFTSTLSVGGATTLSSTATIIGALDVNSGHTQANFLSFQTTASAASTILPDGAFGVYYLSVSSMALAFRSGVTTYTVRCTAASVL